MSSLGTPLSASKRRAHSKVPRSYFQWANGSFSSVQWVGAGLLIYYLQRDNAADTTNITAFPDGFRMLTGDPFRRSYQDSLTSEAIGWNWFVAGGDTWCIVAKTAADLAAVLAASALMSSRLASRICRHTIARTASEARFVSRCGGSLPICGPERVRKLTTIRAHSLAGTESTSTAAITSLTWRTLFGTRSDVSTLRRGGAWIQLC